MASSLDGRIGLAAIEDDQERSEAGISSEADRNHLKREIASCEAVLVGASSIRANGECIDWNGAQGKPPYWVVFAQSEIPEDYKFWQQSDIPRIIISPNTLPIYGRKDVELIVSSDPVASAMDLLKQKGFEKVLLFGGGIVNSWFYERKCVDELSLTLAPVLVGQENAPRLLEPKLSEKTDLKLISCENVQNFLFLKYAILK